MWLMHLFLAAGDLCRNAHFSAGRRGALFSVSCVGSLLRAADQPCLAGCALPRLELRFGEALGWLSKLSTRKLLYQGPV